MPPWLEALLEVLSEKFLLPNWDRVRGWFLKSPLLVAVLSIVPIFGPLIAYGLVLDQFKYVILLFADILLLILMPIYPFYKLFTAIDVWVLTKRKQKGKELGNMEWFWN